MRVILHVDMDAFYAAVEQRDNPDLRGKPILVGGSSRRLAPGAKWTLARDYPEGTRGVVMTASYEARPFGCRSAMPMSQACRLCPHALVVPMHMDRYIAESRRVRTILESFTPDIEPLSIDEAFLDLTNVPAWSALGLSGGEAAAREIKRRIREETGLTASVGVAPNKFLAKVASDFKKPDGLCVISQESAAATLAPMPVSVIFGVGKVAQEKLARVHVKTVADLLALDDTHLAQQCGPHALEWKQLALGKDDRAVHSGRRAKSIGKERTFGEDIADHDLLRSALLGFVEDVARDLRDHKLRCRRVTLKLKTGDFRTFTRSATFPEPTDATDAIWTAARDLLAAWLATRPPALRLLGVSAHELTDQIQLTLFDQPRTNPTTRPNPDAAADAVVRKLGEGSIRRAAAIEKPDRRSPSSTDQPRRP